MSVGFIEGIDEEGNTVLLPADFLDDIYMPSEKPQKKKEDRKKSKDDKKPKYNEWVYSNNQYLPANNTKIKTKVEPGFYSVLFGGGNYALLEETLNTDELHELPNSVINQMVSEIDTFWEKKDLFKENKIVHKRGILLYGGPGCGKTSIINLMSQRVIDNGGLVFHIKSSNDLSTYLDFMHIYFRDIEPETPVVTVIEDIDKLLYKDESSLLNFLDGGDQLEHNVVVATTNRLHELNDLVVRPSRFDQLVEVELPDEAVREFFLKKKGIDEAEIQEWVSKTKGLSMAELKELFIAVKLLDNDFQEVMSKLKDKKITTTTYKGPTKSVGFK